jgi:predicted kinase
VLGLCQPKRPSGLGHDEAVLVVVSGLPAVGKSELADALGRRLGAAVLSVDPIEAALWRCGIAPSFETGVAAYEVVAVLAEHQLQLGLTVIADAVSSLEVARDMWRRAASRTGAEMRVIEVVCSHEGTHRERLARRARNIVGFPEPSWEDVVHRRDEWEPWKVERLVVDSLRELDENVTEALAFVNR